jgi:hypothetical protein
VQRGKLTAEADDTLKSVLKSLGPVELTFKVEDVQTIDSGTRFWCAQPEELSALATKDKMVNFILQMTKEQASSIQRGDRIKMQGRLELKNPSNLSKWNDNDIPLTDSDPSGVFVGFLDAKLVSTKK